jgi:penicillin-binding protein 1A
MEGTSSFHKVIWRKIMQRIHNSYDYKSVDFTIPDTVVRKTVCSETGKLAADTCTKITEYFDKENVPNKKCSGHVPAETPASGATAPAQ